MLTHLPIRSGDPVTAFLIEVFPAATKGSAPCYSNERGAPLTSPIKARYNDYGSIESIDPNSEMLAMSFLNFDRLIAANADEDDDHDRVNFKSLESICSEGAERGNLRVKSRFSNDVTEAGLVLIHRAAFEAAVSAAGAQKDWHGVMARDRVEKSLSSGLASWQKNEARRIKLEGQAPSKQRSEALQELRMESMMSSIQDRNEGLFTMGSQGEVSSNSRFSEPGAVFSAAMDPESRQALIEMRLFCEALSSGRMDWRVSPGAGSQDQSAEVQLAVAAATQAIMAPRLAEAEENRLADEAYDLEQEALAEAKRKAGAKSKAKPPKTGG